ncbi:MAG: aminopeptidase [Clostridia bacterium]|nr:aminopeptidase [Clostridia bacterium]
MEDNKLKELKDELLFTQKNAAIERSDEDTAKADAYAEDYKKYLNAAKTERLAVSEAVRLAEANGFVPFDRTKALKAGDKVYVNNRGKALILAVIGSHPLTDGVSIAAAHVDSPRLDLKPNPLYEKTGMAYFDTHYYGSIKKYLYATVPLALYGVVTRKDGSTVEIAIGDKEGDPVFVVTDLLIHLSREQMQKPATSVVSGENLDILIGSRPFDHSKESDAIKLNIMHILNERYGITETDFLSAELEAVPAGQAKDVGFDRSLVGGYGHDDRVCAYPALTALFALDVPAYTAITLLCDKEEIGSDGATGTQGNFFPYFMEDLADAMGVKARHVYSKSLCLSADVNSAYDPLYASAYCEQNSSFINRGVVLTKYTGSGGKGGSNDASAEVMGTFRRIMDAGDVIWQIGELGAVDAGGGGTVAKYIAQLDVDTVDLGVPVLSMHAPFEVISKLDLYETHRAFYALLNRQ